MTKISFFFQFCKYEVHGLNLRWLNWKYKNTYNYLIIQGNCSRNTEQLYYSGKIIDLDL